MRKISFRGKAKNGGKWLVGYVAFGDHTTYIFNMSSVDSLDNYEVDPETVGQFTGLKDKDGIEVFEGDIVEARLMVHGKPGTPFSAKIIYNEHIANFQISYKNGNDHFVHDQIYFRYQIAVIGNIYDNPELLE